MKHILMTFILSLLLISCGGYRTSIIEKDNAGYLKFTGNTSNVTITLNDENEFQLDPETELYKVEPGQYNLKAFRDNNLLIDRIIIVEKQTTIEIEVP